MYSVIGLAGCIPSANSSAKTWMIDRSDTAIAAISNTIPDAKILACLWHVREAIAKQAKEKLVSYLFLVILYLQP